MPKVTFVGAGSAVFARQLITDILAVDGLDSGTFALVDVDLARLELARQIAERLVALSGKRWTVSASTDRTEVLEGSDYVINSIEVAGLEHVRADYAIPKRYGVDQCIGDTIGPGGQGEDRHRVAVVDYARSSDMEVVGLCHSVQGTSRQLASYLDIPYDRITWRCAGINHNAWFTTLEQDGEDLYPLLRRRAASPEIYERDPVRFEVMLHLGAFVTESSGHFSEYVPYFRKRPDLLARYTRAGYLGESGFYANNWPDWRRANDELIASMLRGETPVPTERGHEYASAIVEAIELGREATIHGNVVNKGWIDNLPDGCVEVECRVDRGGLHPVHFGPLPEQLAALNRSHMAVHELVVQALFERDRQKAKCALMLDPLTAAVCSLEEIDRLFEEMGEAERGSLTAFG